MKTLMLTALLFLAISGWAEATEPTPVADEPVVTPAEETTATVAEETAATPAEESVQGGIASEPESADEITLEEPGAGAESVPAAEADAAEGELGWMADAEEAESDGADARVAEVGVTGDAPFPDARPADTPSGALPADTQGTPGDSLMMDVGEVLDELLWPEPYLYQSAGTRDPFAPLVGREGPEDQGPPAIGDLVVVGVVWGEEDRFALVETRAAGV